MVASTSCFEHVFRGVPSDERRGRIQVVELGIAHGVPYAPGIALDAGQGDVEPLLARRRRCSKADGAAAAIGVEDGIGAGEAHAVDCELVEHLGLLWVDLVKRDG